MGLLSVKFVLKKKKESRKRRSQQMFLGLSRALEPDCFGFLLKTCRRKRNLAVFCFLPL